MVNNRKVRVMARTAMYEQHEGARAFKRAEYYKSDYVGIHMILAGISMTIAYILILVMTCVYKFDYIIENITELNYPKIFSTALIVYVLLLIVYMVISYFVYSYRYEEDMYDVKIYLSRLRKINELSKNGKNGMEE